MSETSHETHRIAVTTTDGSVGSAPTPSYPPAPAARTSGAWRGWAIFAAAVMMLAGAFHAIAGLIALFNHTYYVVPQSDLVVTVSYTGWGWVHLIGGVLVILAGLGLLAGRTWARVVAIVLAGLSALVNIAFLPAWPVWSVIVIALDIVVIYALTVHGDEIGTA